MQRDEKGLAAEKGPRPQRNFLRDYDTMLKALMLDYVDCARYEASGYAELVGKLYTMNAGMFQSPIYCDHTLTQMMLHYLLWFQDPAIQLVVGPNAAWHMASTYRTQRYGDALYVVQAAPDAPVKVGERIVGVNKMTLAQIRPEVERTLCTTVEPADPEREDWSCVLAFARHLTVVGLDGVERCVPVVPGESAVTERMRAFHESRAGEEDEQVEGAGEADALVAEKLAVAGEPAVAENPASSQTPCSLSWHDGVAVLRLCACDEAGFAEALASALDELESAGTRRGLVIDVRGCRGGVQEDIYPLVPYVLTPGTQARPADVFGRPGILLNCSRHNVAAKLEELTAIRQGFVNPNGFLLEVANDSSAADLDVLDELMRDLESKRGAGLVPDETDYYPDMVFSAAVPADGAALAGETVVLADRYTGEAAEWLVRAAKAAGAATVAGRATAGSIDNTCPRLVRLDDDFSLVIPTAKYLSACDGWATLGRGIVPDVHLPWTPEQLTHDADLACACALARDTGRVVCHHS